MKSRELLERSRPAVWHPCTQMKEHERCRWCRSRAARARGCTTSTAGAISTRSARGGSTCSATPTRASTPRSREQLDRLEHVMLAGFTHAPVVELSERLCCARAAAGLGHCFYASDGASAIEIALKMSFHYWRNRGRAGQARASSRSPSGYHGETLGALAVTDVPLFRDAYAPLLHASAISAPSPGLRAPPSRANRRASTRRARAADAAKRISQHAMTQIARADRRAAGAVRRRHGACTTRRYLRCARALCDALRRAPDRRRDRGRLRPHRHDVRLRAGRHRARLPVPVEGPHRRLPAAVGGADDRAVYQAFYDDDVARGFLHSHSYTGNPLACRAALAALDDLRDEERVRSATAASRRA